MTDRRNIPDPDTVPCPDCGLTLGRTRSDHDGEYPDTGPLHEATPFLRLSALANQIGMDIFPVSEHEAPDGIGGGIAIALDQQGQLRAIVGLAENMDEDLRTDILAFAIAMFVGDTAKIASRPDGYVGIGRKRLKPPKKGVGHLAWHMARTCGRNTLSATFELVPI